MGVFEIIGSLLMLIGCVFALTGSFGVLRMPDFYSRLHPAGKTDTLAQGSILLGLACFAAQELLGEQTGLETVGTVDVILKLILLSALLFETAPTSTHAISKAARLDRHTHLHVEGDAERSQISEIVVAGDVAERLQEPAGPVLDVIEDQPRKVTSDSEGEQA
jgi:multicomponent Na+:H+ antiporter subunit G